MAWVLVGKGRRRKGARRDTGRWRRFRVQDDAVH